MTDLFKAYQYPEKSIRQGNEPGAGVSLLNRSYDCKSTIVCILVERFTIGTLVGAWTKWLRSPIDGGIAWFASMRELVVRAPREVRWVIA